MPTSIRNTSIDPVFPSLEQRELTGTSGDYIEARPSNAL